MSCVCEELIVFSLIIKTKNEEDNYMKKIISVVLAIIMAFSVLVVPVSAQDVSEQVQTTVAIIDTTYDIIIDIINFMHGLLDRIFAMFGMMCPICGEENNEEEPTEPEEVMYTVSFDLNYESADNSIPSQIVKIGETVSEPAAPEREGYTFVGWYEDEYGTFPFSFESTISSDTVIYAKWSRVLAYYGVTFEYNNGNESTNVAVQEATNVTEPVEPKKEGFLFDGWYTENENGELFDFSTPIVSDITLYAHWIEDTYGDSSFRVTFMLNDGISNGAYDVQSVMPNKRVTVPALPERNDYSFTGWYTEPETINQFDFSTRIKTDLVLYAGWNDPANTSGNYSSSSGGGTIFSITNIDVENNNAEVTINVNEMSALVVEFLNEDDEEVFHTISAQTPEYSELEKVAIPINYELPEYFIVVAKLFDENGEERCNAYKSIKYTTAYEIFAKKTIYDFDGKTVLNFDESIDNNFGVLSDNVIQVAQDDETNILSVQTISSYTSDETETINYVFECYDSQISELEQGDVVFATDIDGTDQLFKVGEIEFADEVCVIVPSGDNSMVDFYDYLKVDMHIKNQETETSTYSRQSRWDVIEVDTEPSATITPINRTWTPKEWLSINWNIGGSVGLDISMQYDVVVFGKDYFSASVETVTSISGGVEITASKDNEDAVKDEMKEKFNKEFKLPDINVPTPVTGLTVKIETGIPLELSAEGSASITFTTKTTGGFTYDTNSGKHDIDKKERTFKFNAEGKLEAKVGPKVAIGIAFLDTVVSAKVEAQAGVKATAIAELSIVNATTAEEKHACTACVSGTAKWFVNVSVKLEYDIVEDILQGEVFNIEIVNIEGQILFDKFDSCYFSLIHSADSVFGTIVPHFGFGECPNKQYRTTIKLVNANDGEITGTNVKIEKIDGKFKSEGESTFIDYLYDGKYTVSTKINTTQVTKTIVVSGSAQTIKLKETSSDGKITGKVSYADNNNPVSDATIIVKKDSLVVASLSSDTNGNYSVSLPDGTYCVEITKEGYVPFVQYVIVTESNETHLNTALLIEGDDNERGGFSGKITDAVTGRPVSNVKIDIRKGWDNPGEGDILVTLETDENGVFTYKTKKIFGINFGLKSGNYTATASKSGYSTTSFDIVIIPGITKDNQNADIAPIAQGNYRVVLSWGSVPSDLDSHLTGYTTSGSYEHVYYSSKRGNTANLDRDDTNYYGPETITITNFDRLRDGFAYSVHDFSNKSKTNSKVLSSSGAVVKLYKGDTLLKTYYVPVDKVGTVWRVFSVDAEGNITDINYFYNQSSAGSVN